MFRNFLSQCYNYTMTTSKYEAVKAWLDANPDKQPEDWLLEVRCRNNEQREKVSEILRLCNENHLIYEIPWSYHAEPDVWFDFAIHNAPIDLDAPDELFDNINPKRPWEAAAKYLSWKAAHDFGEGYEFDDEGLPHLDYFHDFFMDWRSHEFLEGFVPGKKFD